MKRTRRLSLSLPLVGHLLSGLYLLVLGGVYHAHGQTVSAVIVALAAAAVMAPAFRAARS